MTKTLKLYYANCRTRSQRFTVQCTVLPKNQPGLEKYGQHCLKQAQALLQHRQHGRATSHELTQVKYSSASMLPTDVVIPLAADKVTGENIMDAWEQRVMLLSIRSLQ